MWQEFLIMVGGYIANEVFNRVKYDRQLKRIAAEGARHLPKSAREIATQALIEANQREMERAIRHIDDIRANSNFEWREAVAKAEAEAEAAAKRQEK